VQISSACSPVSGCEISSSSMLTPASGMTGSSACSASMKAQMPPSSGPRPPCSARWSCPMILSVNFDHPAARQAADAERDIQAQRARGMSRCPSSGRSCPKFHHRALPNWRRPDKAADRAWSCPWRILRRYAGRWWGRPLVVSMTGICSGTNRRRTVGLILRPREHVPYLT
jgi:hypothetical protein